MRTVCRWCVVASLVVGCLGLVNWVYGGPAPRAKKETVTTKRLPKTTKDTKAADQAAAPASPAANLSGLAIPEVGEEEPKPEELEKPAPASSSLGLSRVLALPAAGLKAKETTKAKEIRPLKETLLRAGVAPKTEAPPPTNRTALRTKTTIPAPGPEAGINIGPTPPAPAYTTYLGSQTPSLSVDWVTPETIMVGQEGVYELVLRNSGRIEVERIVIEQVLPQGFRLIDASPQPEQAGPEPVWKINQLNPQEEARISLRLMPTTAGEAQSQARVTFSTFAAASFKVVEPKLEIVVESPESAIVGDQAIFTVTVRNPGSGPANNTVLRVRLPDGLAHVAESSTYELGTLNADESRSIQILADVMRLGDHVCDFVATADGGLRDDETKRVRALGAQLAVEIEGPAFRYVTRPAQYNIRVRNVGTAAAQNIRLRSSVPASFAFLKADNGGRFDAAGNTINWYLGQLEAGDETKVQCDLRAMDKGEFPILAQAVAERGLRAEAQHVTQVEGIAAILLEVVDVDDPVEVGTETFYEVVITNQGTNFATNVQLTAEAPEGMAILAGKGPSEGRIEGRTIRFAPLRQLAPRADAIYRITVRGTRPGDFRMRVQATADTLDEPVQELESTKVYQD